MEADSCTKQIQRLQAWLKKQGIIHQAFVNPIAGENRYDFLFSYGQRGLAIRFGAPGPKEAEDTLDIWQLPSADAAISVIEKYIKTQKLWTRSA
jgi:hypothetical protein